MKRKDFLGKIKKKIEGAYLPMAEVEHPGSFVGYSWEGADAAEEALVAQFKQELEALQGHVHVLDDIEETAEAILSILNSHQNQANYRLG